MGIEVNNPQIFGLFPTPILTVQSKRKLTDEEMKCIERNIPLSESKAEISSNTYILNEVEMSEIKSEIQDAIKIYVNEIIVPESEIDVYITQSWLTFIKDDQHYNKHFHVNSFISGVYYVDVNESVDCLHFYAKEKEHFYIKAKEWNLWNSTEWWIPVKNGLIVLFPSNMSHMVKSRDKKTARCSLAFNTFVRGKIGSYEDTSELKLN